MQARQTVRGDRAVREAPSRGRLRSRREVQGARERTRADRVGDVRHGARLGSRRVFRRAMTPARLGDRGVHGACRATRGARRLVSGWGPFSRDRAPQVMQSCRKVYM